MIEQENYLTPKQIVIKNAFWLYFANFLNKILRIVLVIISARILGPYLYGNFTYALSIIGFFLMFSDWGLSSLLIRNYQIFENKKVVVQELISLKLLLIFTTTFLAISGYFFLKDTPAKIVYFILLFALSLDALRDLINSFFKAIQKMEIDSISIIIESIIVTFSGILFLYFKKDIFYLGLAYFLGAIFSFIFCFIKISPIFRAIKFEFSFLKAIEYLKQGTPLLLLGFLGFIFFSLDHIMIGYLKGMQELGYYSPITKIILNLNLIPGLAITALFPYLSKISLEKNKLKKIYRKIFIGFIGLASVLAIILVLSANLWFLKLFGGQYEKSLFIFKVFIWIIIFLFGLTLLDNLLFILGKQWLNFYATSFCAILNIILNLWLIPLYGALGASLATLAVQFINFLISLFLVEYFLRV